MQLKLQYNVYIGKMSASKSGEYRSEKQIFNNKKHAYLKSLLTCTRRWEKHYILIRKIFQARNGDIFYYFMKMYIVGTLLYAVRGF